MIEYNCLCIIGPRRFGKTFILEMFECFMDGYCFNNEKVKKSNKEAFKGLKVSNDQQFCSKYQQNFFVIKLDFSKLEAASNMLEVIDLLTEKMHEIYEQFLNVCKSQYFLRDLDLWKSLAPEASTRKTRLMSSLDVLVKYIRAAIVADTETNKLPQKIALLIDEFDKPYVMAFNKGQAFYKEFQTFMNGFLSGIKGDIFDSVFFTGIQPLPLLTPSSQCLNDVVLYSIFEDPFCHYYGFTEDNMDQILQETGLTKYKEGFRRRYNGYQAKSKAKEGSVISIYNPYSVMMSIEHMKFGRYWCISESSAQKLLKGFRTNESRTNFCILLVDLIKKGQATVIKLPIAEGCKSENYDAEEAWSNLIFTGYLQRDLYLVSRIFIPNVEITPFLVDILQMFYGFDNTTLSKAHRALRARNMQEFAKAMVDPFVILTLHSSRNEAAYLVFLFMLVYGYGESNIVVESEKKMPGGVSDLVVHVPEGKHKTVYVFEVKYLDGLAVGSKNTKEVGELLRKTVDKALGQIDGKRYDQQFYQSNALVRVGVAFTANRFMLGSRKMPDGKAEYYDLDDFTGKSAADSAPQQAVEHVDDPMIGV